MSSLSHLIYCSSASADFEEAQIPSILERARAVPGMLIYVQKSFFQVLEGEATVFDAVFDRIRLDPRHRRITRIITEPIVKRSFGEWSMGFSAPGIPEAGKLLGENDFFASASCV